ncbi:MAG: haloalkane dehalogenase [Acidobacteriota bacterium]|nr:MAG: haloalkane dehalogenase [Acidobacteriota bacterium]
METLRTPDDRYKGLPDFPYAPHYVEVEYRGTRLRMHYVDEGDSTADPVLMLHGEPSWSFLYRKMIPIIRDAGHRCLAPDLIGFGRSDKLARREDYTYQFHVDVVTAFIEALDLGNITLVCQDWGGLIGLRIAAEHPDRFARIVAANTFLPTGDQKPSEGFLRWQHYSQTVENFHVGGIIRGGCVTELSPEVITAYNAPFPDDSYKAGARQFPVLVPTRPDDPASEPNRRAWEVLKTWRKPFLTAFSDQDPVTAGADKILQKLIPGCAGQPHTTITGGGHFLQEDKGEELARVVVEFIAKTK